ncbi:MAG TPA: DUF2461 domain-containing protein [Kofleriaceae bacterium]|nr:DUF2461 domain-containing protein [Kofleriaceae bacterium]
MPKPAAEPARFTGFDRSAPQFFHELAAEMNRDWFEANKQRYQTQWVVPMTALLGEVAAKLAPAFAPIKLGAPKLFRIYRDVRFSKDKAPYKTHIAGVLTAGSSSVMYIHLGLEDEFIGVGTYFFDDRQLVRWRKLVAADATGKPLAALVGKLRKAGYRVGGHDDYKKVPRPYPAEHPRAEFLRMRGLTGGFPEIPKGLLHRPELVGWLVRHGRATAPLVTWLARHVK